MITFLSKTYLRVGVRNVNITSNQTRRTNKRKYHLFNLSNRFCIIDVIPRADRVICTENIISKNRIRPQIPIASRRLKHILRICVCDITSRRPHFYLSHARSLPYICVKVSVTGTSGCRRKPNLDVSLTFDTG